jgi:hypothetical protein
MTLSSTMVVCSTSHPRCWSGDGPQSSVAELQPHRTRQPQFRVHWFPYHTCNYMFFSHVPYLSYLQLARLDLRAMRPADMKAAA